MFKHMLKLTIIVVLSIFFTPFILAEGSETSEQVFSLEKIVVTATRSETKILDAPVYISIVTSEEIEKTGAKTLADILSNQTSLIIRDYGAIGALKNLSIRGASSGGVLVLIDGVRLNSSRQGGFDLSLIPIENIERIEIVRGGTSALYGADAVGGVVNIITKKSADGKLKIKFENGSYIPRDSIEVSEGGSIAQSPKDYSALIDTQIVNIEYSNKINDTSFVTTGSFIKANNNFIWKDSQYTGEYRKRINAYSKLGNIYTGVSSPLYEGIFNVSGILSYGKKGVPGKIDPSDFSLSTDASQTDIFISTIFNYKKSNFLGAPLTLDTKAFYKYYQLSYKNPDDVYPQDDKHTTHTIGFDLVQKMSKYDFFDLIYGTNFILDIVDSTQIGEKNRISGGIFLESPIYTSVVLTLVPAIRYDIYSDFPNSFNFKVSSNIKLNNRTAIKGSIAKSYRAPTLNDLYWPSDPWTEGNPDLTPETSYSAEAGISAIYEKFKLDLFLFSRYTQDEIKWSMGDDFKYRPYNIQKTLYPGFEIDGACLIGKNIIIKAGYTFIYSFLLEGTSGSYKLNDDLRVPNVPVHSIDSRIEYITNKHVFGFEGEYLSQRYTDEANSNSVDPYLILNLNYRYNISNSYSASISVDNLLNKAYQNISGYIMPPLFIRAGLQAKF